MTTYYTYWSYEPFGRCYIGYRKCPDNCTPETDDYLGSYTDKTFKPTHKLVLSVFDKPADAIADEISLHLAFDVACAPHFANRAKQTSTGFSSAGTTYTLGIESRKKISEAKIGKTRSAETRKKISETKKGKYVGENSSQYGKPAPNRNHDIWTTHYDWIKNLYIGTSWGSSNICKAYNKEFNTNHGHGAFTRVLEKIKAEKLVDSAKGV